MKKYLFIAAALYFMAACAPIENIKESRKMFFIDYGKYSEKGFLFTPYIYNGDFDHIGPVEYSYSPGAEYKSITIGNYPVTEKNWVVGDFDIYTAIDDVYNECLKMNADALIETKITTETVTIPYSTPAVIPVIKITGFAIRRK